MFFYPKSFTSICTKENQYFAKNYNDFKKLNTEVYFNPEETKQKGEAEEKKEKKKVHPQSSSTKMRRERQYKNHKVTNKIKKVNEILRSEEVND